MTPSPRQNPPHLRSLIDTAMVTGQPVVLPGCYDALGARLIEQAGFDGVYMTGFGTTAGLLASPDVGLLGMAEMVDKTPLKRLGQPRDIALGALWLTSGAGSWVTGKIVEIDGGIEGSNLDLRIADVNP